MTIDYCVNAETIYRAALICCIKVDSKKQHLTQHLRQLYFFQIAWIQWICALINTIVFCAWGFCLKLFCIPCQKWQLQWQSKTRGNLLYYRKSSFWERKINRQVSGDWADETTFEGTRGFSGQGRGKQAVIPSLSVLLHKRQHCFLCATPKTSPAGTDVNEERLHLFLPDTETESTQPPLMKSGKRNKDGHCFTLCLVRGWMPNITYTSKTRITGGPLHSRDT